MIFVTHDFRCVTKLPCYCKALSSLSYRELGESIQGDRRGVMAWVSAKLDRVYDDPQGQNFNVYADCTITNDKGETQPARAWANDLGATSLRAFLQNVVNAANKRDANKAELQAIIDAGGQVTPAPLPTPQMTTVTMPTAPAVVQIGSVMSAYAALIAAEVITTADPGYQQALSDAKAITAAHAEAVSAAVADDALLSPAADLVAESRTTSLSTPILG